MLIRIWNERPFTTMKLVKILYILAETYLVHLLIVINDEYGEFIKKTSDKKLGDIHAKLKKVTASV